MRKYFNPKCIFENAMLIFKFKAPWDWVLCFQQGPVDPYQQIRKQFSFNTGVAL